MEKSAVVLVLAGSVVMVVLLMLAEVSVVLVNSFTPAIILVGLRMVQLVGGGRGRVIAGWERERVANKRH